MYEKPQLHVQHEYLMLNNNDSGVRHADDSPHMRRIALRLPSTNTQTSTKN